PPSSTDTLLEFWLATARSSLPSRLKSATATEFGCVPAPKVLPVNVSPVQEQMLVLSSTDTLLEPPFAAARSGMPSRLKSPTATACGVPGCPKLIAVPRPPVPLPNSTDTLREPWLASATSRLPSLLKSPTATE